MSARIRDPQAPVPTYRYDERYNPFSEGGYGRHGYTAAGYKYFLKRIEKKPMGENFLWCADIQKDEKAPLYVDKVHYSAWFTERFARVIANLLVERSLIFRDREK